MRGWLLVSGDNSPFVLLHIYIMSSHCYHGFYCYAESVFQKHAIASPAVVGHLRFFMHFTANAVPDEFPHNSISSRFAVCLDCIGYVSEPMSDNCLLDALIEGFLGCVEQPLDFRSCFPDHEGVAGIPTVTIEFCSAVNRDDIAIL